MRIKIFLTSSCHYCNKAKEYLKKRGADFIDCNVRDNPDVAKEMVEKTGQYGAPVIVIDGNWDEAIIGFDKEAIEKALNKNS